MESRTGNLPKGLLGNEGFGVVLPARRMHDLSRVGGGEAKFRSSDRADGQSHGERNRKMLINRHQLDDLASYRNQANSVVSLYLNIKPPRDYGAEFNSLLHDARRQMQDAEHVDKRRRESLNAVLERMETHVRHELQGLENTRLVTLFADADELWEEYRLPLSLPSRLVIGADPYVRPLSTLLEEFERILVLVVDSRHARLFGLYLGEFEEIPDVFIESEVPDRVRVSLARRSASGAYSTIGVSGATGSRRVQEHIEDHIQKHLKNVALMTLEQSRAREFTRLMIGAPDEKVRSWLKNHLHTDLRRRLVAEFSAQPTQSDHELRLKALDAATQYKRERDKKVVDDLLEKSSPKGLGVLGLAPVLEALRMGQVHTLIVRHDFETKGFVCPSDHLISIDEQSCPLCGDAMQATDDIIDELVEEAVLQSAQIEHISAEHEQFDRHRIGAVLRFALPATG